MVGILSCWRCLRGEAGLRSHDAAYNLLEEETPGCQGGENGLIWLNQDGGTYSSLVWFHSMTS